MKSNPLPKSGRLLFFSFTRFDKHPGDDVRFATVLHLPDDASVGPRSPPDTLMTMNADESTMRSWLEPGSQFKRVDFRFPASFA